MKFYNNYVMTRLLRCKKSGIVALIIFMIFLLLTGCEQATWNDPVHEFFEYYTNTAAIVESVIDRSIGSGSIGIDCVESNENKTISLVLRNPQHYILDFSYDFDNSLVAAKAAEFSNAVYFIQSSSRENATVVFSKEFLYAIDNGDACYTDSSGNPTSIVKDLSGTITIKESISQREFESFHISVMVNTIPPRIRGAMYQRDNTQYVICFYVPNLYGSVHEKDTKRIYIGNDLYYLEFSSTGLSGITKSDGGTPNLVTSISGLLNVDTSAAVFQGTAPAGYVTLYYLTGLDPAAPENATVSSSLRLTDDYGFSNTIYISNTNPQLSPVTLSVTNSSTNSVEDDTGLFTFTINHDCTAYRTLMDDTDPTGQATVQVPAEDASGAPTIIYNIFKVGTTLPVATGSGTAPVSVSVEKGQFYVEAYACYSGYVDSGNNTGFGSSSSNPFTVHRSLNYYVNASGSALGNGSLYNPYNSLQKCLIEMISDAQNDYVPGATYTIKLQSSISPISTDVFDSTTDNAFASFKKPSSGVSDSTIKYKIEGNGYTINAGRSSGNPGYVIRTQNNVELTINNVTITGGNNTDAGGIYMNGGTLNLNGVTVTGNYAESGAGIKLASGILNLNGVTVKENTLTTNGSGAGIFYTDGTVNISGRNTVDRNYNSDGDPANFYISKDSPLNITGAVTGSLIRISKNFTGLTEPEIGTPVIFTSGFGYGSTNTELPGKVFKGDTFAVVKEGTNAAFAKSGAEIYNTFDFNFNFTMATADADGNYRFTVGQAKDFTITPVVTLEMGGTTHTFTYNAATRTLQNNTNNDRYYDSDGDESQMTWAATLLCGGELTGSYAPAVNNNIITIPAALPYPETYVLHVTATYMGIPHSKDFIIYGVSN